MQKKDQDKDGILDCSWKDHGREYTAGISMFGEATWYKLPKTADLTELDDRWRTAICLGKSDRSDEHIIGMETGAVIARSVRVNVEGKRRNEKGLKMVTTTPWHPRPGEVVVRRRYGLTEDWWLEHAHRTCLRSSMSTMGPVTTPGDRTRISTAVPSQNCFVYDPSNSRGQECGWKRKKRLAIVQFWEGSVRGRPWPGKNTSWRSLLPA